MSLDQRYRVKNLYDAALKCNSAHRADFLQWNGTDDAVNEEVRRLLAERE